MIRIYKRYICLLLLGAAFALLLALPTPALADELPENVAFAITENAAGEPVGPYYDYELDGGTRCLFVPSHVDTENLTIHYAGEAAEVSEGKLNKKDKTISGNLTGLIVTFEDGREIPLMIMRTNIPSLEISLPDMTLDDVHADKNVIATNTSAVLIDPNEPNNNFDTMGGCEFRGRGNSSWEVYEKKGYQLKLDEARMVLGMDRAKTWILLANSSDPTLLRNKIIYDITKQMDFAFAPEGEFVDLWVNGEYRGNYLMTEKVQIGMNRLDLTSGHGILAEFDNAFYNNEIYFQDLFGASFTLKDSSADDGLNDFLKFQEAVDTLDYLLSTKANWGEIEKRIDAGSFARLFLVNEYFANCESAITSFFWYRDGEDDVLHAGPVWDYDTCMRDGLEETSEYYVYQNVYFNNLLKYPEFQQLLTDIYANECRPLFETASNEMYALRDRIAASISMNYERWDQLGETDGKGHVSFPSYELNFNDQRKWLQEREQYFSTDGVIGMVVPYTLNIQMSEDGRYADFYLSSSKHAIASAECAVSSEAGGSENATWISAWRETDASSQGTSIGSVWHARLDLQDARYIGTYHVKASVNGQRSSPVAEGTFFVRNLPENSCAFTYEGLDFSPVFDPLYYAKRYPVVLKQCGYDKERLFNHFIQTGIRAGYQGNAEFNVLWYRETNEDLAAIYNDSYISYYEHYLIKGMAEGRPGRP